MLTIPAQLQAGCFSNWSDTRSRTVAHYGIVCIVVNVWCVCLSAQEPADRFDERLVQRTVAELADTVHREYFDPVVAQRISASLRDQLAEGKYAHLDSAHGLATMLTHDLRAISHDKHLNVSVADKKVATATSRDQRGKRSNFGVQRVEILAGNVGYLNLTAFYRPDEARDTLEAAMRTLSHAEALILDLRRNAGGSPDTASFLATYFFLEPQLPLFKIIGRSGEGRQYTTASIPPGQRNASRPVYLLTSSRTFSAGEGFAFLLQERQRAEVVGERTAGAANPGRPFVINTQFEVTVPTGKVVTEVTAQNWEGSGVTPDVQVRAAAALTMAYKRALGSLHAATPPGPRQDELQQILERLEESPQ